MPLSLCRFATSALENTNPHMHFTRKIPNVFRVLHSSVPICRRQRMGILLRPSKRALVPLRELRVATQRYQTSHPSQAEVTLCMTSKPSRKNFPQETKIFCVSRPQCDFHLPKSDSAARLIEPTSITFGAAERPKLNAFSSAMASKKSLLHPLLPIQAPTEACVTTREGIPHSEHGSDRRHTTPASA